MKVILELEQSEIATGYITATKIDDKGSRKGKMPLQVVADLLRGVFDWDASGRQVEMISRFEDSPYIALGQNGSKWVAVKDIPPAPYYLVSVSGQAYQAKLPRLVAKITNYGWPWLFWTPDKTLGLSTRLFPLVIGNIDVNGRVCLGSTGLKCPTPKDIDRYVKQLIEAPSTGTYLPEGTKVDTLYAALAKRWNRSIGKRHAITLKALLARPD